MKHRLFIVEGLPCVGKSSTSKYISEILKKKGCSTEWFDEGTGRHPADYEFHSYMTGHDINQLTEQEQKIIKNNAIPEIGGYIIPLASLKGEVFNKVLNYKIYDILTWENEKVIMLKGWENFVLNAKQRSIYVFNCCLLQNPMCETMIRFDYPYEVSKTYIENIIEKVKSMHPVVIYLACNQIYDRISSIAKERDKKWLEGVIKYHTSGEYGKKNKLKGFDGYIDCLIERQKRELKMLDELQVEHLILQNPYEDWNKTYLQISTYLNGLEK